jgi:casein kinase II subunit beta
MYKQQGAAGLDRKRISDVLDKHLDKAVAASPSTSRGSAGARGDHNRLVVPSSLPKGRCSEGNAIYLPPLSILPHLTTCRPGESVVL